MSKDAAGAICAGPVAALPPGQSPGVGDAVSDRVYSRPPLPPPQRSPGIPPQDLENIESAPGNGWPAEAAPAPDDSTPMIMTPTGWRRQNIRIILNGVAAC